MELLIVFAPAAQQFVRRKRRRRGKGKALLFTRRKNSTTNIRLQASMSPKRKSAPPTSQERPSGPAPTIAKRRPVRPIDRQKMRPWLEELLRSGELKHHLFWKEEASQIFAVKWKHAARHGYNPDDDATVFKKWAEHTGAYKDGDTPDPNKWKANFRCALHSLNDVEEVSERGERKGNNATRTFRFLDEPREKKSRKGKSKSRRRDRGNDDKPSMTVHEDSDSGCSVNSPEPAVPVSTPPTSSMIPVPSTLPDFQSLGIPTAGKTTYASSSLFAGGSVTVVKGAEEQIKPLAIWGTHQTLQVYAPATVESQQQANTLALPSVTRIRTPSGDSGVDSSPSHQGSDSENSGSPLQLFSSSSEDECEAAVADPFMSEFVAVGTVGMEPPAMEVESLQADWNTPFLGVPNVIEAVVTQRMETSVDDDFQYTCLENMDPDLCTVVLNAIDSCRDHNTLTELNLPRASSA